MKTYDLVVLGSGGAGYRVAMRCREAGWRVAVVESNSVWGGTCDNRGCIPKKVLVGAAALADAARRYAAVGVVKREPELDWAALMKLKTSFTEPVSGETKTALEEAGVELLEGSPRFVRPDAVEVSGMVLTAKHIHIAVGAQPMELGLEGAEHLLTSDDVLSLPTLPRSMVFVGGGYVSLELAHVMARFGVKTTILHRDDHPLAAFDADAVQTLIAASRDAGIEVVLGAAVERIERQDDKVVVHAAGGRQFAAEVAVHGAGRVPAIATLNLEAGQVAYERRGVVVNDHLQSTSNPRVYAGGDAAAAGPPLSPVARLHGTIVADNLLGGDTVQPNYRSTPSVVFTEPVLARVGLTEAEAKAQGMAVRVQADDMAGWFDAKRTNLQHTRFKVLLDKATDRIVGAHVIGNEAAEVINLFALAIESGLTATQFKAPIYAFPTPSDDARYMV